MAKLTGISILCCLLAGQGLAAAQNSTPAAEKNSYRVDVRLVQVDAQVINKRTHRAAGSLKQDDLQIYEDGVQQQISYFSQDELPLSVVMLFDLTDSVRPVLQSLSQGGSADPSAPEAARPGRGVGLLGFNLPSPGLYDRSCAGGCRYRQGCAPGQPGSSILQ
jgi:hypothetical protein